MTGSIRCLILDDEPDGVVLLTRQLQKSGLDIEVRSIEQLAELRDALAEPCDILLTDYRLGDATALDALRVAAEARPGLPVIVISGVIAEEEAAAAFRAGACDFLTKGRLERLARAIRREVEAADERERTAGLEGLLAISETQFSAVLSRVPGLLWAVDSDLRYVVGRGEVLAHEMPGWADLLGWRLQDAPGVTQEMITAHEIALGGRGISFELALGDRTISARIEPVLAPDGTVSRLVGFGLDVSAERERERRTTQLATVVEALADPAIVVDASGAITSVNPAAGRVLGRALELLVGAPLRKLFREGHASRIEDALERALSGEAVKVVEVSALRGDESLVDLELSLAPISERGTVIRGAAIVARDVSARNALQAELRQAQKMEAVGRSAGGIAHDLNNVLLAVRGYASLLQEDLAGTAAVADVQEIADAAARATALVGRLLAFTRHQVLAPRIVDLGDAVERVTTLLRSAAGPGVELVVAIAPGLPAIEIDPVQVDQLLLNLVINARDAMGIGAASRSAFLRQQRLPATRLLAVSRSSSPTRGRASRTSWSTRSSSPSSPRSPISELASVSRSSPASSPSRAARSSWAVGGARAPSSPSACPRSSRLRRRGRPSRRPCRRLPGATCWSWTRMMPCAPSCSGCSRGSATPARQLRTAPRRSR